MKKKKRRINSEVLSYNLMLLPGIILLMIFVTVPLFGLIIAFQNYVPARGILGSKWVGLDNFIFIFSAPNIWRVIGNTVFLAVWKLSLRIIVPVIFALMLNEVKKRFFKRTVQTIVYMPYFLSWVIMGGVFVSMFSVDGIINMFTQALTGERIMFMASNFWFPIISIGTDVWKMFGYDAILFLAALTSIDANLYEAAAIDGANRWKQLLNITLPGIVPTIVLVASLNLGHVLNGGFDQVFNMYNPLVYESGDILDTLIYRMGLVDMQFSLGTLVGFMKSLVGFVLIVLSYWLAKKFAGYKIF